MTIKIRQGIYDIATGLIYQMDGYWNEESRVYMYICDKFKNLLEKRDRSFLKNMELGILYLQ